MFCVCFVCVLQFKPERWCMKLCKAMRVTYSDIQVWACPTCPTYCTVLCFGPWWGSQADRCTAAPSLPLGAPGAMKTLGRFPVMSIPEDTTTLRQTNTGDFILCMFWRSVLYEPVYTHISGDPITCGQLRHIVHTSPLRVSSWPLSVRLVFNVG